MSVDPFVARLLAALGDFFEPIDRAASDPDALRSLMASLGWRLDPALAAAPAAVTTIAQSVADLAEQAEDLLSDDGATADAAAGKASDDVIAIAQGIAALTQAAGLPDAFQDPRLPEKLLSLLVHDYLADYKPRIFAITRFAGLLDEEPKPAPGASQFAVPYLEREVRLDRVATLVTDPGSLPADVYKWGKPDFSADAFLRVLEIVARAFGLGVGTEMTAGLDLYWDDDAVTALAQRSLVLPIWSSVSSGASAQADMLIVPLPAGTAPGTSATKPEGIALLPRFRGTAAVDVEVVEGIHLTIGGEIEDEGLVRAELRPSGGQLILAANVTDIDSVSATLGVKVEPHDPYVVLGAAGSSRLEIAKAHAEFGIGLKLGKQLMHIDTGLDTASLVIDLGKGDGFLQKLLGGEPQQLDFGFGVKWSTEEGLRFDGTATLRLELPVHLDLAGVAQIDTIHLVLGAVTGPPAGAQIEVSVTGGLAIGPFAAQVDRLGVLVKLVKAADHKGALGDMDLAFAFKPPNGIGFVVDAGPVTGGGYVSFDFEAGEYAGILDLEVAGTFAIKAIGILATKMPDGRTGFSMLLIITAEFSPIQLGYGFTLNGVGGAIGINRTMDQKFLSNGIHTGALESILFPPNPVAHANEVISNLKQGFPIDEGRIVFGPMVKLGWASIITAEVGILLELPMPVRLALLGRLRLALPPGGEDAVLVMQIDIAGFFDFGTGDIAIDATLNDSRIVAFPISGDFALRANVGSKPDFALSAGGFHPRFLNPPAGFPALKRLGISISSGDNPRLRLEAYFGFTTNSVQVGARADFYAGADFGMLGSFSAEAQVGFDALMYFSPFYFEVDIYGRAAIKRNGDDVASADLEFKLDGPAPWHVHGHAIIHFLGDHTLSFDRTFGEAPPPVTTTATDVAGEVRAALGAPDAWGAVQPGRPLVTLRDAGPVLHPLAELSVHQRVAPIETRLERFGTGPVDGPSTITIDAVAITGVAVSAGLDGLTDTFAPGQYFELSDDEKLTRPAFERLPAGKRLRAASLTTGSRQPADQHFVTITVDNPRELPHDDRLEALAGAYKAGAALRASMAELSGTDRYTAPSQGIAVAEPAYAVAGRDDLAPTPAYPSYTAAAESAPAGDRRIVGAFEAAA
jgi:hypothetical protein